MMAWWIAAALAQEPPRLIFKVEPDYPEAARGRGIQGEVLVRLSVDESGAVASVVLVQGLDDLLDLPALEAARSLRFEPATQDGAPVAVEIDYRFHFSYDLVDEQEGTTAPGSLFGRVEDEGGTPVRATLTLLAVDDDAAEPQTLETGDDGRFRTGFLAPGHWEVYVTTEIAPT